MKNKIRLSITDPSIIKAFFGTVKSYHYVVTGDDFDEHDNQGPGTYSGIEVSQDQLDKWKSGISKCNQSGIDPKSRDGMLLRLSEMKGVTVDVLPNDLEERFAAAKVKAEETRKLDERLARLQSGTLIPISHSLVEINERFQPVLSKLGFIKDWPDMKAIKLIDSLPHFDGIDFYELLDGMSRLSKHRQGTAWCIYTENPEVIQAWLEAAKPSREKATPYESWTQYYDAAAQKHLPTDH